ncbi:MAG: WG repeat-containing protein [Rikenellaceae bacterium]
MAVKINNFIDALYLSYDSLASLKGAVAEQDEDGKIIVSRTKFFADVEIHWQGKRYILSLPLCLQAYTMAQYAAIRVRPLHSKIILKYRLLHNELTYIDSRGEVKFSDLLLQEIPEGYTLKEAAPLLCDDILREKLNALEEEFGRLSLKHNNLKSDNIILSNSDNLLYPIRLHYATIGEDPTSEFQELRHELLTLTGHHTTFEPQQRDEIQSHYREAAFGYSAVGAPHEGLCVAENSHGYFGYINPKGDTLITPQFVWASNLCEGRAEVETSEGMGLIDRSGKFIIEPHYKIIEFDPTTGRSRAKVSDNKWLIFDYNGCLIR